MRVLIGFALSVLFIAGGIVPAHSVVNECPDYTIIGARGTNQPTQLAEADMGPEAFEFARDLKVLIEPEGSVELIGVDYPAGDSGLRAPYGTSAYPLSIGIGAADVIENLRKILLVCDYRTDVVLVGYSQGAAVMGEALKRLQGDGQDKLDLIAGVAVFGDPEFNPDDTRANTGTYDPNRTGFFGPREEWHELTDAPVVSSACRYGDVFCQGLVYIPTIFGPQLVENLELFAFEAQSMHPNLDYEAALFREHVLYEPSGDITLAAARMGVELGLLAGDVPDVRSPLDVAILVDSTSSGAGVVEELRLRASEFVESVMGRFEGARVAVVDYKGGVISEGNPYITDVKTDFTDDPEQAVDAIEGLTSGGGPYGAIYSALGVANDLDWDVSARRITLTLSTSRACGVQYCLTEAGTGVDFHDYNEWDLPLETQAGVVTFDQEWFFESAGWNAAMSGPHVRRPGAGQGAGYYIDELASALDDAVSSLPNPLVGTGDTLVGQTGYFNAADASRYFSSTDSPNLQWSYERIGPLDGGGGVTVSSTASRAGSGSNASLVEDESPNPTSMGPLFQAEFPESGLYEVRLDAYGADSEASWTTSVRVEELPESTPAAPLLSSFVDDGDQVLAWTAGAGEPAVAYNIVAPDGTIIRTVVPAEDLGRNGVFDFEYAIPLATNEAPRYRVTALNFRGETEARALLSSRTASFDDSDQDFVLRMAGAPTPELRAILEEAATPVSVGLEGSYMAKFVSPSGDELLVDMTGSDAVIEGGTDWSLAWDLDDLVDVSGREVSELIESPRV